MTWIQTYTGRQVDLLDPDPNTIDITDIAHALSNLCRFTGHVASFVSVAQHSCQVSSLVPSQHALTGLMHDATEAYVADLSRPLKQLLPEYKRIEDRFWSAIAERFDLPAELDPSIKQADNVSLMWERRDLMCAPPEPWFEEDLLALVPPTRLESWTPAEAKDEFLARFQFLDSLRSRG